MRQKTNLHTPALIERTTIKVRFSEIDSMQIVWHGEYVRYFEDGRESFGKHYGLGYMDIYSEGYMVPIVELNCNLSNPYPSVKKLSLKPDTFLVKLPRLNSNMYYTGLQTTISLLPEVRPRFF